MKKANLIVCFVMVATMLVSACSGGTVATQAQAGATQPSGQKVNLVYWSMWNKTEPAAIALTDIIGKFAAANPNIIITPVWNGRENQTKVRTALGATITTSGAQVYNDAVTLGADTTLTSTHKQKCHTLQQQLPPPTQKLAT